MDSEETGLQLGSLGLLWSESLGQAIMDSHHLIPRLCEKVSLVQTEWDRKDANQLTHFRILKALAATIICCCPSTGFWF